MLRQLNNLKRVYKRFFSSRDIFLSKNKYTKVFNVFDCIFILEKFCILDHRNAAMKKKSIKSGGL